MKFNLTIFIIASIFFITLVSSASALIVNPNSLNINKTIGQQTQVNLQILNNHNFTMFNISFQNNILTIPKIDSLSPGQSINVTRTINSDVAGNSNLVLQGFYLNNLGTSNNIYDVNITSSGVSSCDRTIISGDSIRWFNSVLDPIVMYNHETGVPITTINSNSLFTSIPSPTTLKYYLLRNGFNILGTGNFCTITILNTTGYVNNPDFDAHISLNLQTSFPPTSISNSILTTSYVMGFADTNDGVFQITNTGSQVANVNLSGEWLSFSTSTFTINPGQSKGITYTIKPIISQTSQTNITYTKNIVISGNFPTQNIPLQIKINYANIGDSNTGVNNASLDEYLKNFFCPTYPQYCQNPVVYRYVQNGSSLPVSVNATQEALDGSIRASFDTKDIVQTLSNQIKIDMESLKSQITALNNSFTNSSDSLRKVEEDNSNFKDNIIFGLSLFLIGICAIGGFFWWKKVKMDKQMEEFDRY